MSFMRVSVCVTKYKLFICPKVRISVGVVHCWVSTIGQQLQRLRSSRKHYAFNFDRSSRVLSQETVDGARGGVEIEPIGRTTRRLEDASDRTTGESIKSAVCNTEVTEEATSFFAMTKYIILIIYLIITRKIILRIICRQSISSFLRKQRA